MKRQHLFNNFWSCFSAVVLVAPIAWADTKQVSALPLKPKVSNIQEKPAPTYLNPSPNPLQLHTLPEEVRIQGTQPISLQQAHELARRNNRSLQVEELIVERSRAALREQRATVFPTISTGAEITRQSASHRGVRSR